MCALFGLFDYNHALNAKQREKVLRVLSQESEERGTDATGFAYNSRGKLTVFKRPFAAHNVHLKLREDANITWATLEWQRRATSLTTETITRSLEL